MSIDLTPILQALIALMAALVMYRLIPWIRARTTKTQQDNMRALCRVLVYAAEQIYGAGKGEEKLQYVCDELRERGFEVNLSDIEAAVYEEFNFGSLLLRAADEGNAERGEADSADGAEPADEGGGSAEPENAGGDGETRERSRGAE